ncbi:MAG: GH3 auxin-responsive promoter family protein [Gemmatimonadota bacterium]
MKPAAALVNALWLARSVRAATRFSRALRDPGAAQARWLRGQLQRHASSVFGHAHDFRGMRDAADYARFVPLCDYAAVSPSIARIQRGERDVLSCDPVRHLAPTSGSSGARKLIPFTTTLQAGFASAVGAWMLDLVRQRPRLVAGPAYWSVSPLADDDTSQPAFTSPTPHGVAAATNTTADAGSAAAIPVGFAADADYLGGSAAWLVRQVMAAPDSLRHVRDVESFRALTLLALLRQPALRLISVWHPSFLDLLVDSAAGNWPLLLEAVASGGCPWLESLSPSARPAFRVAPSPRRAAELRRIGPHAWMRWWPRLQVVSCWGDQAAAGGWQRLRSALPGVLVQAKGLLATEGVVTIPFRDEFVLAVSSHFFEFIDDDGDLRLAHQVERGKRYEVVLTNGGGLWRYRLGDAVECTGFVRATPTLRFVGRMGQVSDLRGEKLSEAFVAEAIRSLWTDGPVPVYAALCAVERDGTASYELRLSEDVFTTRPGGRATAAVLEALTERLEIALQANPHYALARRLGQLHPLRVVPVSVDTAGAEIASFAGRLGDAKPRVLVRVGDPT